MDWQRGWRVALADTAATAALARALAGALTPPRVVALVGEMGAGKTTFVRALAEGWEGVDLNEVASPTYALMHLYPGARGTLVHLDLWRVPDLEAAVALGMEEAMARDDAVVLAEWADRLPALLPAEAWGVRLEHAGDGEARVATVVGPAPERLRGAVAAAPAAVRSEP